MNYSYKYGTSCGEQESKTQDNQRPLKISQLLGVILIWAIGITLALLVCAFQWLKVRFYDQRYIVPKETDLSLRPPGPFQYVSRLSVN